MEVLEINGKQRLDKVILGMAAKCSEQSHLLVEAYRYAADLHKDQRRKSGEPYIIHPVSVAQIIANEFQIWDAPLLSAALLHDVVEDVSGVSIQDIRSKFGSSVAELVDGCTKIKLPGEKSQEAQDRTHSKILLSGSKYLGVFVIKLADRLHNLRTLFYLPSSRRQRIARETLDIYAPLAAALNMFHVKRELYNLAIMYLYPKKSKRILSHIQRVGDDPKVLKIKKQLEEVLGSFSVRTTVRCRPKGLGSYYNRERKTLEITNAENYVDFTIVVHDEDPFICYNILGIVNSVFPPQPRTIRDFIANPKTNGYQSLHARFNHAGYNFLVKIRTASMDTWAMYGILRKWREDRGFFREEHNDEITKFLREIGAYGGPAPERKKLLASSDEIIVYSPDGDSHILPKDSTVLDFAYKIHSDLGDRCKGAFVNGILVGPTHIIQDGARVEILTTSRTIDVDPEYELVCKTARAKSGINRLIQKRRRFYAERVGREIVLQLLEKLRTDSNILKQPQMWYVLKEFGLKSDSELFIKVGQDLISLRSLKRTLMEVFPEFFKSDSEEIVFGRNLPEFFISIGQLDNAVHKFAKCCKPYPGEDSAIAVLSERGVTVHKVGCNEFVLRHDIPVERLFKIKWMMDSSWDCRLRFLVSIQGISLGTLITQWPHDHSFNLLDFTQEEDKHNVPQTRFSVVFNTLMEAKVFFERLYGEFGTISIEKYQRFDLMDCN